MESSLEVCRRTARGRDRPCTPRKGDCADPLGWNDHGYGVRTSLVNALKIMGTLLAGSLVAASVVIAFRASSPRTIVRAQHQQRNGHCSMAWRLSPSFPLGIQIVASDPHYSTSWRDRTTWESGKPCDTIVCTLGDDEGSFFWRFEQRMGNTAGGSSSGTRKYTIKSLTFSNVRARGRVVPGSILGTFRLESEDGHVVTGEISVIEVTEELLYPPLRQMSSAHPS
jgi:hypothetical protein